MGTAYEGICQALSLTTCDAATVAQTLGGFSAVAAAVFALIAVPIAWWQMNTQRQLHAMETLQTTAESYFKLRDAHGEFCNRRGPHWTPTAADDEWLRRTPRYAIQFAHCVDVMLACARRVPRERLRAILPLLMADYLRLSQLDEILLNYVRIPNVAATLAARQDNVFSYAGERLIALYDEVQKNWDRPDMKNLRDAVAAASEEARSRVG